MLQQVRRVDECYTFVGKREPPIHIQGHIVPAGIEVDPAVETMPPRSDMKLQATRPVGYGKRLELVIDEGRPPRTKLAVALPKFPLCSGEPRFHARQLYPALQVSLGSSTGGLSLIHISEPTRLGMI